MRGFVERYDRDLARPTPRQAWADLLARTLAPALVLWAGIVGVGLLIVGPLGGLPAELALNRVLVERRTPLWDAVTHVWSTIGGTAYVIGVCLVVVAGLWWRTRRWWFAVVPALAISVQSAVFVTSAFVVGRERPDVEHLDRAPPTSGFPSGHTGASTAFYLTLALVAQRIRPPGLRWSATGVCLLIPLLVAFSRLYRGMHHLTDVAVGLVNGVCCAWLAWRYLRRDEAALADP